MSEGNRKQLRMEQSVWGIIIWVGMLYRECKGTRTTSKWEKREHDSLSGFFSLLNSPRSEQ